MAKIVEIAHSNKISWMKRPFTSLVLDRSSAVGFSFGVTSTPSVKKEGKDELQLSLLLLLPETLGCRFGRCSRYCCSHVTWHVVKRDLTLCLQYCLSRRAKREVDEARCKPSWRSIRYEEEVPLNHVRAIRDVGISWRYVVDVKRFDRRIDFVRADVTDRIWILGNLSFYTSCGRLLNASTEVATIKDYFLDPVTSTGSLLSVDYGDGSVCATDFIPVGDVAGVDVTQLIHRETGDIICWVNDDGDRINANLMSLEIWILSQLTGRQIR